MIIQIYLFVLMAMEPVPTFGLVNTYNTMDGCKTAVKTFIKHNHLTDEQASKLICMPVVTSPYKDTI